MNDLKTPLDDAREVFEKLIETKNYFVIENEKLDNKEKEYLQHICDVLNDCYRKYLINMRLSYESIFASLLTESVMIKLNSNDKTNIFNDEENQIKFNKSIKDFSISIEIFEKYGKSYWEYNNERIYIDIYQLFEYFISDIISSLYKYFPVFLNKNDKTFSFSYEEIFNNYTLSEIQNITIENQVKSFFYGNNIIDSLKKILTTFAIKTDLHEVIMKAIYNISKNRNLLIHNNGIVNNTYIKELKRYDIISQASIGKSITPVISRELESTISVIFQTSNFLFEIFQKNLIQIYYYSKKL